MKTPTAQQAINNLRTALTSCHQERASVSAFDVEFVLYEIERLSNNCPTTSKLSTSAIISRIKNDSIHDGALKMLECLNDTLMTCHSNNVDIEPLNVYGLIFDILRLMRGETDFIKLPMIDLERAIYTQLRG